jgi:hypothetical protein
MGEAEGMDEHHRVPATIPLRFVNGRGRPVEKLISNPADIG